MTTWDAASMTQDVESSGTKTRAGCEYTQQDGVVITLDGTGDWMHERHYVDNAPAGTWITTYVGGFDWMKDTGEMGSCTYDLTRTVDTAANMRTLTGMSCGNVIDRMDTWRG